MLSRRSVSFIILAHLIVAWGAVALRVDRFPLTWAPMYSLHKSKQFLKIKSGQPEAKHVSSLDSSTDDSREAPKSNKKIKLKDLPRLEREGWLATRRSGLSENISRRDINVPMRNMWRLYYERTFGKGSPKYKHMNHDAGTWDRWLWGLEPGEEYISLDWRRRLLESVNKTYSLRPENPDFIVSLRAYYDATVIDSDGSITVRQNVRETVAQWDEAWSEEPW